MIFKDYLESLSGEIDVYSDYEDTDSATLVWEGIRLTEYGKEKYHDILEAPLTKMSDEKILLNCSAALIEEFTYAAAGYISEAEYDRCFLWLCD